MKTAYLDKLRDPRWQRKRLKILERDNFTCTQCGNDRMMLDVHHEKYKGEPWDAPDHLLSTLCRNCHTKEHTFVFEAPILSDEQRTILTRMQLMDKISNPKSTDNARRVWRQALQITDIELLNKYGIDFNNQKDAA